MQKSLETDPNGQTTWHTKGGTFSTDKLCKVSYQLLEFTPNRMQTHLFKVDTTHKSHPNDYNVIIGCNIIWNLGIQFDFASDPPTLQWDDFEISMPKHGFWMHKKISTFHHVNTLLAAETEFDKCSEILPAKYHKAELAKCVPLHLAKHEQEELLTLLQSFANLFEGKLMQMPGRPYQICLKPHVKPFFSKPFPVPQSQYKLMRDEVDCLVKLGVLQPTTKSEWAAPSFGVLKRIIRYNLCQTFNNSTRQLYDIRIPYLPFKKSYATWMDLLTVLLLISTWDIGQYHSHILHKNFASLSYHGVFTATKSFQWD